MIFDLSLTMGTFLRVPCGSVLLTASRKEAHPVVLFDNRGHVDAAKPKFT